MAKNTKYSKPQLEDAFRAANGGKALTDDAAKDLKGTQVADEVLDAVNDVADAACKAFDLGLKDIADTQLGSPLEHDQATGLLAKMKSDVAAGRATTESIDLACKAKDALAQF